MARMMLQRSVLGALICLIGFSGQVEATLYMATGSSTVSEGTDSLMNCYSAELEDENIFSTGGRVDWYRYPNLSTNMEQVARWTLSNGPVILLPDPDKARFSLEGGLSTHNLFNQNLRIRSTSKTDQGRYFCILYNGLDERVAASEKLSLTVRYPPAEHFPSCTATPSGSKITLSCKSEETTPPVTVQWYKDGVKVADGVRTYNLDVMSTYDMDDDELDSLFICRLIYDNGVEINVQRSCQFNRPYVAILRMGAEQGSEVNTYHAFSHSNPPFVSDIDCFLESSSGTILTFHLDFSGYGMVTVGPVVPEDNGTNLVCRAKNVLGWGEARMPVYSYADGSRVGETALPSVVTNYTPSDGTLVADIWPKRVLVYPKESVTFGCSYSLATQLSARSTVDISWKYNDIPVDIASMSRFSKDGNTLTVTEISEDDDNARVTCVATMLLDETAVVSIPSSESSTELLLSTDPATGCQPSEPNIALQQTLTESTLLRQPSFAVAVSVLAGIGWFLLILLLLIIVARNRRRNQAKISQIKMSSQMTYRASAANNRNNVNIDQATNPALRALPSEPPSTVCLGGGGRVATDSHSQPRPSMHVVMPIEQSRPEVAYQEMVGNTGLTKSRKGDTTLPMTSSNGIGHGPTSNGSAVLAPATMVPAPNGGFIPQDMLASNASSKKSGHDNCENYEDLDRVNQQRVRRAAGNDYQTPISNRPEQIPHEEEGLLPHYANS